MKKKKERRRRKSKKEKKKLQRPIEENVKQNKTKNEGGEGGKVLY